MATNVTFWYLPEDEKDFLDVIENKDRVIALPLENQAPMHADSKYCLPRELITQTNCTRMFLTLSSLLTEIRWVEYEVGGKTLFGIDAVNSPVISYSRGIFREENKLSQAAISAYLEKLTNSNKKLVEKSDEYIRWVKDIFSYVRKSTPEWHEYKTYRISTRVAGEIKKGLQLVF